MDTVDTLVSDPCIFKVSVNLGSKESSAPPLSQTFLNDKVYRSQINWRKWGQRQSFWEKILNTKGTEQKPKVE
jgi:hypothetical protein